MTNRPIGMPMVMTPSPIGVPRNLGEGNQQDEPEIDDEHRDRQDCGRMRRVVGRVLRIWGCAGSWRRTPVPSFCLPGRTCFGPQCRSHPSRLAESFGPKVARWLDCHPARCSAAGSWSTGTRLWWAATLLADIAQIASVLGFDGAPRRVVRQPRTRQSCGHGRRGRCETSPQVCPAASGGLYRPSAHGPPLDTGRSMVRSGQAATMGGPRKRSIRRRISANSARGTATSASWKTT